MPQEFEKSLKSIPLFDGIDEGFLRDLAVRCHWKSFAANQQIISHLDGSSDVFFVVSGKARVIIHSASGKAIAFRDIGPGGIFGEFAAIDAMPRSASVEGLEPGVAAQLSSALFREALNCEPAFMTAMMRHLVGQVRTLTDRVVEFSTLAVNHRVHAELLRLASQSGKEDSRAHILRMPTHSEFASRISTHREAVTRELNRLAQMGLIERQGSTLLINDLPRLARMVREATGE